MIVNLHVADQRKLETPNKCDLFEKITINVVSVLKVQNVFFNLIQSVSLNILTHGQLLAF